MPSIKSGRFITTLNKSKVEGDIEDWSAEEMGRIDSKGFVKLTLPAEESRNAVNFMDESLFSVEITHNGYGIKKNGDDYWDLFKSWDEAKAAFDKLV